MKFIFLSIFIFFTSFNYSYAANYISLDYSAKAGESIKSIMLYFYKDRMSLSGISEASILSQANEAIVLTMNKNPLIRSWNPLIYDVEIKLYLDPSLVDFKKVIKYKQKDAHHFSLSSMPSFGQFSQSNNAGFNVKYDQISYFSIGIGYLYTPYKNPFHMSASIYYSTISPAANQVSNVGAASVDIPAEYGGNLYGIYKPESIQFSFYSGIDFERFSSFNMQNILNNSTIAIDTNSIYYITAGLNFKPNFLEKVVFKVSFSRSIFSDFSSTLNSSSKVKLSGLRMLAFITYRLDNKWSFNFMYKGHSFSGDNDLSIKRVGAGISYYLF